MNSHVGAAPHTTVNVGVNAVAGPNKDVHDGGVGEVLGRGGGGGTAGSRQAVILPGEAGLMQRKRKPRVQATLQNVVEVSFSKDSCFFPSGGSDTSHCGRRIPRYAHSKSAP